MNKLILMILVVMFVGNANAAVLCESLSGGSPYIPASLSVAATSNSCRNTNVVVTSPQVVTTAIAWPEDRELQFEKGGYVTFSGAGALSGLKEVSPDNYGAGLIKTFPYDTAAVQAAFDSGAKVKFTSDYTVDNVKISGVGKTIDFNGFSLIGGTVYSPDYMLAITGRELSLYNIKVNANFKSYSSAVRWFSVDAGNPAQYNKVYGMRISYAISGLTFGQAVGTPSTDAAQSENTIYGLTFRGVQNCFTGNQTNGFLTLVAPVLDCNPNEWSVYYPGVFNPATARSITNVAGTLQILGGEILKTYTQLGFCIEGKNITTIGTTYEAACAIANVTGHITIRDAGSGFMSSDSSPAFVIDAAAAGCRLLLENSGVTRGTDVSTYSPVPLIEASACPTFMVVLNDCNLVEWKAAGLVAGCPFILKNTRVLPEDLYLSTDSVNLLPVDPYGNDVPTSGAAVQAWTLVNGGGGTPTVKRVDGFQFMGCPSSIEFTGAGGSAEFFTPFFRVTANKKMLLTAQMYRVGGSGNSRFVYGFYDANRVMIGALVTLVMPTDVGASQFINSVIDVPAGAIWMRLNTQLDLTAVVRYSGLRAIMLDQCNSSHSSISVSAIPSVGTWMRGETVYPLVPVVGSPKGWVCTVSGTPGTWVSIGNL